MSDINDTPPTTLPGVPIGKHKPHWLQVWKGGQWTDDVICSTCGAVKRMNTMSTEYPDPAHNEGSK